MAIESLSPSVADELDRSPHPGSKIEPWAEAEHPLVPALEVYDVIKTWRGTGRVLDGVELIAEPGSAIHISGRNGSGKTTLLRIAVGLIKPDSGLVSAGGLRPDLDRRRYQQRMGFLAAGDRALYARMTVRHHMSFWARLNFIPRAYERLAIEKALSRFGLEELADRRVDRLSMGQRQRTRLAGAFVHDPTVVLLDEPRNSLDDDGISLLVDWANEVLQRGGAVIWCSPSGEATRFRFTDHYKLEGGKLSSV